MTNLESFLNLAESNSSCNIEIFCPKLSVSFLWKILDDLSIYRRRNIDNFSIYFSSFVTFNKGAYQLNECIEMQELFETIEIFCIDLKKIGFNEETVAGIIVITGQSERKYTYESEFSLAGFNSDNTISQFFGENSQLLLNHVRSDSIRATRANISSLECKFSESIPTKSIRRKIKNSLPDFELSFLSSRTKLIHNAGAGLNWGQPTATRKRKDKNAAYLPVNIVLQNQESIPGPNIKFLCKFEDGIEIEMVRTGENGKNLTSAYDNQIFGRYIRHTLKLSAGALISQESLANASIFGLRFYKDSDQNYFVEFNEH